VKELMIPYRVTRDADTGTDSFYFTAKCSYQHSKNGAHLRPPLVIGWNNRKIDGGLIENGMTGKVKIVVGEFHKNGRRFFAANLVTVKVKQLQG
jgi:hypothetical protein